MTAPVSARPRPPKGLSRLAKVLIAAGIVLLLALGFGSWALFSAQRSGPAISSAELTVLVKEDLTNSVRVTGTVQPHQVRSISTSLTGKVQSIDVEAGDRVEEGQLIAVIDTQALERDLENARVEQGSSVANSESQVSTATTQLENFRKGLREGTNPEIVAAEASLRQAISQRDLAISDYNAKATAYNNASAEERQANNMDAETKAAKSTMDLAISAVKDAETGVQTAKDNAAAQLVTLENAVKEATNSASTARTASDKTLGALQSDIDSGRITAPMTGVVMSVGVKAGSQPTGAIVTIGDDSKLTITTTVRAADVSKISEGNQVVFTSDATGSQEFTGLVTHVSRIAQVQASTGAEGAGPVAMGGGSQAQAEFTVQIEVTGKQEGLYIGSNVKADIITEKQENTLVVPQDAVYESMDGSQVVLVLTNMDGQRATLEERRVETGMSTDASIAITGGELSEGDVVISFPGAYMGMVGQEIEVQDAGVGY